MLALAFLGGFAGAAVGVALQELSKLHIGYHLDVEDGYHPREVRQTQIYNAHLWLHW